MNNPNLEIICGLLINHNVNVSNGKYDNRVWNNNKRALINAGLDCLLVKLFSPKHVFNTKNTFKHFYSQILY